VVIASLTATINDEAETLTELVEPYLLKIGFIVRTPNGRRVTRDAYTHLGLIAPAPVSGQPELFS
jgi:holliday junction DNA helicase RuvB